MISLLKSTIFVRASTPIFSLNPWNMELYFIVNATGENVNMFSLSPQYHRVSVLPIHRLGAQRKPKVFSTEDWMSLNPVGVLWLLMGNAGIEPFIKCNLALSSLITFLYFARNEEWAHDCIQDQPIGNHLIVPLFVYLLYSRTLSKVSLGWTRWLMYAFTSTQMKNWSGPISFC